MVSVEQSIVLEAGNAEGSRFEEAGHTNPADVASRLLSMGETVNRKTV
jgi:hypothetical protein